MSAAIPTPDFIHALWQPGEVREVRIPKYDGRNTASGYFDNAELLVGAVDAWDGKANVYVTLNPVKRALLARATNRIVKNATTTTGDQDIEARHWLLLDFDPVRPTGISSTEEEREAAHARAKEVYLYLLGEGWPTPISGMSGNGYQLLYPIDLPNDDDSRRLVEGILGHLNQKFSDEAVKIDTSVGNASRIGCLFGTLKVKGDDVAERPHRRSKLLTVPADMIPVPLERLQALAPATNGHAPQPIEAIGSNPVGWVKDWLDAARITYREHGKDGITWYRLDVCPVHPDDDIGGDCAVAELRPGGPAVFKCLHDRGKGKDWKWLRAELKLGPPKYEFTAGAGSRAEPQSSDDEPATFPIPENRGQAVPSPLGGVEYVADFVLPGRILVVAAEEGTGKSFATDDELAIRVAVAGGNFAGTWEVLRTGNVLVLSEMHSDDDYAREEMVLESLGLSRDDLDGKYFRLSLFTAAHGKPALMDAGWRRFAIEWIAANDVVLAIFDTGTAATEVEPWGKEMRQVIANAKEMVTAVPTLAIAFVVHFSKPKGRGGQRGLSSVMGEWGRWGDVILLMENDGNSLERVVMTVRKRVRQERRFIVTKRGGLLVDPVDISQGGTTKVPLEQVAAVIAEHPGVTAKELGALLTPNVSKDTAARYAALAEGVRHTEDGPRGAHRYFAGEESEEELRAQL